MPVVHVPDLPWQEQRSPTGKFRSLCRNISLALGGLRNIGTAGGGHPFDVQIRRIAPGDSVCPYHSHLAQWEFFLVLAGRGSVRVAGERHDIRAGDCFVHPPGEPHQITATGPDTLEVLIVADNPPLDGFHYPDSRKWGLRTPAMFFRVDEVDYFAGEDEPPGGCAPLSPSTVPALPASGFAGRRRHLEDIAWDIWESPQKKFRGAGKELSIALGAKRGAPTGLGGHPFDVEFDRIAPGQRPCPFHQHAAQWEFFYVIAGQASVRAGDATHALGPGDACLHPPGEPHDIRNRSATDDLEYLLIADNPPVDYWYYPDSRKWGLREPRMFFRPAAVEYYDGEE